MNGARIVARRIPEKLNRELAVEIAGARDEDVSLCAPRRFLTKLTCIYAIGGYLSRIVSVGFIELKLDFTGAGTLNISFRGKLMRMPAK